MRTRDVVLLSSACVMAAVVALSLLAKPSEAGGVAPPGSGAIEAPAPDTTPPVAPAPVAVDGGPVQPSAVTVADPVYHHRDGTDTTGWTSGVIMGDIALTASVVSRIQTLQVVVDELRSLDNKEGKRPWHKIARVELGVGTPTFEVRDVPFSPYGYVVSAYAPGLNGSQTVVEISERKPLCDDVRLAITPGAPFSLLLRDQDNAPLASTEVSLVPFGAPGGRPPAFGTTDNFGCAVFEHLLAGDYQVRVGPASAPLLDQQVVTVQSSGHMFHGNVPQPQGQTLIVPRGVPLTIRITDRFGGALEGAAVHAVATDRATPLTLEGTTDIRGTLSFPRVLAGIWQITVWKQDYDRRTIQLTLDGKTAPPEQLLALGRLR